MSKRGATHTSRRLVQERGVYDSPFNCQGDPIYKLWHRLFARCYGARTKANECYTGCEVDPRWFSFMAFKSWCESQSWEGMSLEKDLLQPGNRIYGPDTCCFVPQYVNMAIITPKNGGYTFRAGKKSKRYEVMTTHHGERIWLGAFDTDSEAIEAHRAHKKVIIKEALDRYLLEDKPDARVVGALQNLIL